MTLEYLQNYWWVLVSVLGGILVFLLFVQGGQSMIYTLGRTPARRDFLLGCMGSKWELTYTTLVVFGGAMFASFPLYYSTCFGGAYWLWILILFSFVLQAVSYEYRRKKGNLYGTRTYDAFLFFNGLAGCVLLGVAVSLFFFGGRFTVARGQLLDPSSPVISQWCASHGFEAIFDARNLVLGIAVFFLARMQACLYMLNRCKPQNELTSPLKTKAFVNGAIFVVFFLLFLGLLIAACGIGVFTGANWWIGITLLAGVVLVLGGWVSACFVKGGRPAQAGIWYTGTGTFLAVAALFFVAGFANPAFLPSVTSPESSLTLRNASSSEFTLKVMSYVSIIVPFVLAYIAYVWRKMDHGKLADITGSSH